MIFSRITFSKLCLHHQKSTVWLLKISFKANVKKKWDEAVVLGTTNLNQILFENYYFS